MILYKANILIRKYKMKGAHLHIKPNLIYGARSVFVKAIGQEVGEVDIGHQVGDVDTRWVMWAPGG